MQAVGVTPPVLNLKSLTPGRAEAYPSQDLFKSLLQQRMVSRGSSGGTSSTRGLDRSILKAQLSRARPTSSASRLETNMQKVSDHASASKPQEPLDPIPLHLTRKLIDRADRAKNQNQPDTPAKPVDSSSQSWKANLRSRALKLAQGNTQTAAVAVPTPTVEMPPTLKSLIEFLNQQPGQALKVPPDRLPEVEAFLLQAGMPQEQVKNLTTSPRFQEQGLSATDVVSAWSKAVQDTLQQDLTTPSLQTQVSSGKTAGPLNPLQNLTSQPDYQHLWQGLTLPMEALGDLRLELQQMGVPQEVLSQLNQQNYPQGIPLTQVWQLMQQAPPKSPTTPLAANAATGSNPTQASPPLLNGETDLEKWRQLLVQAGMDPELAQTLASGPSPTNREELRTSLLKMAPPSQPAELEAPQPLYLPENVRVRMIPQLQQQPNAGQGGNDGSGNLAQNFTFSPQVQEVKLPGAPDLNNFLALLIGNNPPKGDQLVSPEAAGAPSSAVNTFLTPEAREALWSQVQTGIMSNLRPGENQVTLTLTPPDMGKLHLTLSVKGEMVEVTAITSHSAVAEAGTAGVQQLAQALNQQGLILTQFQFHHQDEAPSQSNLAFFQNSGDQKQAGKKDADRWERPPTPRRQRDAGGIDCFA